MDISAPEFLDLARETLERGMVLRFRARGGSMAPFVRDGDCVCVGAVERARPVCGDIVLMESRGGFAVVHRVVGIEHRGGAEGTVYIVAGDAELTQSDRASRGQLVGRVLSIERDGRSIDVGRQRAAALLWRRLRVPRQKLSRLLRTLGVSASRRVRK